MSQYTDALAAKNQTIKLQAIVLALGFVAIAWLGFAFWRIPTQMTVHVQPGLSQRTVVQPGKFPPENIYTFAVIIYQQLNRWRDDGAKDYKENIDKLRPFLTERFYFQLQQDAQTRQQRGELQYRVRTLAVLPEIGYRVDAIKQIVEGEYLIVLNLALSEVVQGAQVKDSVLRYPLRVVAYDGDNQLNPFGLQLDGFTEQPRRLQPDELKLLGVSL